MSLMHFFYGFGAILGPKSAGVLTDVFDLNWRQVYIAMLIPVGLVFLFHPHHPLQRAHHQR